MFDSINLNLIKVCRDYYEYFTKDMNLPEPIYTRGKKWVIVPSMKIGKFVYIVPFVQTDINNSLNNKYTIRLDNTSCKKHWNCTRIKFEDSIFTSANTLVVDHMFPAKEKVMIWTKRSPSSIVADKARKVLSDIKLNDIKVGFVQYYCFIYYMNTDKLSNVLIENMRKIYNANPQKFHELELDATHYIKQHSTNCKPN